LPVGGLDLTLVELLVGRDGGGGQFLVQRLSFCFPRVLFREKEFGGQE
jgi:hypothetical protein